MVYPLLAGASLGVGVASNLYAQKNQRRMYRQFAKGYDALDKGYGSFLARQGRHYNPHRRLASYGGQLLKAQTNLENSYTSSVGTSVSGLGAGFAVAGRSRKWM